MKNLNRIALLLITLSLLQLGMGHRDAQYDEEAREAERQERLQHQGEKKSRNPLKNFFGGVKQATVDSTSDLVTETSEGVSGTSVNSTVEGVNRGAEKVLDNTVKGASKVATFGYGEVQNYEVKEPEKGSDDTTKIRIKIPGT